VLQTSFGNFLKALCSLLGKVAGFGQASARESLYLLER
jgi:hypothetical protein